MVGISLVSIIVLAFRVAGYKSCNNANISFSSDSIFVKDIVRFSSDVKGGKLYSWDFGDGVTQNENIASISHSFKDAKVYTLTELATVSPNVLVLVEQYQGEFRKLQGATKRLMEAQTLFV